MEHSKLLREILPDVLIDNFDVARFEKTDSRFDIYLDEKKVMMREDKKKRSVISYGFGEYRVIQDFPICGRAIYPHVRKRKWLDKDTGEIFGYEWELYEFDETRLNAEFVDFFKRKIESTPVSISTHAARNGLKGQTFRKQYKEKISGYRNWEQLEHVEEYMLFPNKFGKDMSLAETCLSNGVYTILTNKAAHGGQGALAQWCVVLPRTQYQPY